jgi:hypothetical protein
MVCQCYGIVMHGIAELTFFGYSGMILRSLMRIVFHQVLVSIYHHLSRCEAE